MRTAVRRRRRPRSVTIYPLKTCLGLGELRNRRVDMPTEFYSLTLETWAGLLTRTTPKAEPQKPSVTSFAEAATIG